MQKGLPKTAFYLKYVNIYHGSEMSPQNGLCEKLQGCYVGSITGTTVIRFLFVTQVLCQFTFKYVDDMWVCYR